MAIRQTLLAAALVASLSGCATIMGSPTQTLPIASTPSDAKVVITDEAGTEVFAGQTPTSVTLNKSTGRYWGGKSFKVTITKPGFKTQVIPVTSSPNGWYIAGNFVFGGLIGWFAVDPLSGNMYTLSPEAVASTMDAEKTAHNNTSKDGSIAIMLIQDVPAQLRDQLVRIN
ncbi:hypothetical protein [Ideonella sp. YS5]|uniref:hypothetical protein n=1 Tax=Ideonella sp. YS5 TaxID=3453714 RepID=UPI003EEEE57B